MHHIYYNCLLSERSPYALCLNRARAIKTYLINLNLFHTLSHLTMDERYTVQTQIISTRIYLIILSLSLSVIVLYRSQIPIARLMVVRSPSYINYVDLYNKYSQSLSCPCSNINIRHEQFLQIEVRFHQVCESNFVSDHYFTYLDPMTTYEHFGDKRRGKSHLQMIASWCRLAKSSVVDDRTAFYAQQLSTYEVLPPELFDKQIQSLISLFSKSTKSLFVRSLAAIRQMIQGNVLTSGYTTNMLFYALGALPNTRLTTGFAFYPESQACICVFVNNCTEPMIDSYVSGNQSMTFHILPGLLRGCFVDEATLQSTLECYYNQTCLDASHSYFGLNLSNNFTVLDATRSSRFNRTSVIRDILNEMMIEDWKYISSYESFYNTCQALSCSYSYTGKNDLLVIISTIIGLIGGLTTILMVIVPQSTKFVRQHSWRRVFRLSYFRGNTHSCKISLKVIE